jgi:subtilisin family serine protease
MGLRFLSEKGQGTTADAIKAIEYAVRNGAKVLSNSWGSEGEDPSDGAGNRALRDIIQFAQDHGALFVAAAGNGHQGRGYDNDADPKPAYPASYNHDIIVSVAALNAQNQLGPFSNWGRRSVDLGAPGVKVFSTVPAQKYQDTVLDLFGMKVTWDGTSMATPHVAGAAALYWSAYPEKSWREVKAALLRSTVPVSALNQKSVSGGKLNVERLMDVD